MADDEFGALSDAWGTGELDSPDDVEPMIVPAFTALLTRVIAGRSGEYTETMWVHGYPSAKMVTVTHMPIVIHGQQVAPGVVTSIPVGWRVMATAETFRTRCESILGTHARVGGWVRRPHTIQGS
jgi:hypothetical protein